MEIHSFLGVTNEMAYLVGLPIVFALIAIEVLVMALKGVRYYKWDDTLGTLGMLAGNVAMGAVTKSLFFGCMVFTYQHRIFDLQADLPPWLLCLVALFGMTSASTSRTCRLCAAGKTRSVNRPATLEPRHS